MVFHSKSKPLKSKKKITPKNKAGAKPVTDTLQTLNQIYKNHSIVTQLTLHKAQSRPLDLAKQYRGYILRNRDRLEILQQSIAMDCLATAKTCGALLTEEKINKGSAASISLIRREAVYTKQLIEQGIQGKQQAQIINIQAILNETTRETGQKIVDASASTELNSLINESESPEGIEE